jgi:hypothetical protein
MRGLQKSQSTKVSRFFFILSKMFSNFINAVLIVELLGGHDPCEAVESMLGPDQRSCVNGFEKLLSRSRSVTILCK